MRVVIVQSLQACSGMHQMGNPKGIPSILLSRYEAHEHVAWN